MRFSGGSLVRDDDRGRPDARRHDDDRDRPALRFEPGLSVLRLDGNADSDRPALGLGVSRLNCDGDRDLPTLRLRSGIFALRFG